MSRPLQDPRAEREAYYRRIAPAHLTPLWEMMSALVPREPNSPCVPALWKYAERHRLPVLLHTGTMFVSQAPLEYTLPRLIE